MSLPPDFRIESLRGPLSCKNYGKISDVKRSIILFLCLSALSLITIAAQTRVDHFTRFDETNGLVKAVVSGVQDKDGFLWFGTEGNNGVFRYDGTEFRQYEYDPSDPDSLVSGNIYAILSDSKGRIWFASDGGGVSRMDPRTGKFTNFQHDPDDPDSLGDNTVFALLEDRRGQIWLATAGSLDLYDDATGLFQHFEPDPADPNALSNSIIFHLYESRDGQIWIGTLGGGLGVYSPENGNFRTFRHDPDDPASLAHDTCGAIVEDEKGNIWVGGKGGLNKLDRSTGKFRHFSHDPDDRKTLPDNYVWDIHLSGEGELWIGGYGGGFSRFDPRTEKVMRYKTAARSPGSFSSDLVFFVMEDRGGILWIGTVDGGLNKYIPQNEQFSHYHFPFPSPSLFTVYQSRDDSLWIGSQGHQGGVIKWNPSESQMIHYKVDPAGKTAIPEAEILSFLEKRDGTFLIGYYGGFGRFDREKEEFTQIYPGPGEKDFFGDNAVYKMEEDKRGELWIATEKGLIHMKEDGRNEVFLENTIIKTLMIDSEERLWIGTGSQGLKVLETASMEWTHYSHDPADPESISFGEISSLRQDSIGRVWIGSVGGGLNLWEPEERVFQHFTEEEGFISNSVFSIEEDFAGRLWMGSSRGLICYDPISEKVVNYTGADGIQGNEFSIRSDGSFAGEDGTLYFAGKNGLTFFNPVLIQNNETPPSVRITSFKIFNQEVDTGTLPHALKELTLSWRDSMFSFDFSAVDYYAPQHNRYQFKLEGFDRDWIPAVNSPSATYTNLRGGEYVFKVKAANSHGIWNENSIDLPIRIFPPWWETDGFKYILAVVIMGVISLISFYVYKLNFEIKAHRKSDKDLNDTRTYLSGIIDSMPSMMIGIDSAGGITMWNDLTERETGYKAEETLGRPLQHYIPFFKSLEDRIENSLKTATIEEIKKAVFQWMGRTGYYNITIYPVFTESDKGAVIRIDEISEQVRMEEMIIQSEKMLSVGGLAAGMAHEINNPLAGIIQTVDVIKKRLLENTENSVNKEAAEKAGVTTGGVARYLKARDIDRMIAMVEESGTRIARIIQNMLSFSRANHEMSSTHDVSEILDKTLELAATDYDLKKKYDFKDITIEKNYAATHPQIVCDSSKLQQVFFNILRNGAEAMHSASVERPCFHLEIYNDPRAAMAVIEISDNGPGMDEETQKRIFEPFYTTKPVGVGTGLGLSVSYFIITENHNGKLTVSSRPGQGAKFTIKLPLAEAPESLSDPAGPSG